MPSIDDLYQQMKGRDDVVVLTMTIDSRPRFDTVRSLDVPVLYSSAFVRDHVGGTPIPRHWVLDRDTVLRFDHKGSLPTTAIEKELDKAGGKKEAKKTPTDDTKDDDERPILRRR